MTARPLLAILVAAYTTFASAAPPATTAPVDDSAFGLAKGSVFEAATPAPFTFEGPNAGRVIPPPPGSPGMIPHAIDGDLRIAIDRNPCLACHDRPADIGKKAAKGTPRPAPASHYATKDGKPVLNGAQFNCTACHAPQAGVPPLMKNAASPTK